MLLISQVLQVPGHEKGASVPQSSRAAAGPALISLISQILIKVLYINIFSQKSPFCGWLNLPACLFPRRYCSYVYSEHTREIMILHQSYVCRGYCFNCAHHLWLLTHTRSQVCVTESHPDLLLARALWPLSKTCHLYFCSSSSVF